MSESQDKNDIPKPEPSTKCVCPLCKEEFRTEKSYSEHYKNEHDVSKNQKKIFGKYFTNKFYHSIKTTSVIVPRYVQNGNLYADIAYDSGGCCLDCGCCMCEEEMSEQEEISKQEARRYIDKWHEIRAKKVEETYQEILQKMFNEKEE